MVGNKVSSDRCEIEGIMLGIEMAIEITDECKSVGFVNNVHIMCDSQSAISAFTVQNELNKYSEIHQRLVSVNDKLKERTLLIKLVKISGHSGIRGNELADQKAKEVALDISKGRVKAPRVISISDARKVSTDIAMKS